MSEIRFENVSFRYPEAEAPVFEDLSLELPAGIVSLVGQNGTGKTTLLLLAGGSLLPDRGRVFLRGLDTAGLRDERERQRHVSMIYQNLEFETEEPIGALLEQVYENGFHDRRDPGLIPRLVEVFELGPVLAKRTQQVSKGELQRAILAFSLLYGSRILLMDEPVFAMEDPQKERALEFLSAWSRERAVSLYFSLHELDLSRKYADFALLFFRGGPPMLGPAEAIFTRELLEKAYEYPFALLKRKEALFRQALKAWDEKLRRIEP